MSLKQLNNPVSKILNNSIVNKIAFYPQSNDINYTNLKEVIN